MMPPAHVARACSGWGYTGGPGHVRDDPDEMRCSVTGQRGGG
jgi:hypothetical protein